MPQERWLFRQKEGYHKWPGSTDAARTVKKEHMSIKAMLEEYLDTEVG